MYYNHKSKKKGKYVFIFLNIIQEISMLLYNFLVESAYKYPNANALIYNGNKYTYQDLNQYTCNVYNSLREIISDTNKRVACLMYNSVELIVSIFALSKGKNITLLLNPDFECVDIFEKLQSAKIEVVIIDKEVYTKLKHYNNHLINKYIFIFSSDQIFNFNHICNNLSYESFNNNISMSDKVLIQTSSGTTNISKMAYRTNENIYEDSNNIIETFQYEHSDSIYLSVPIYHGYGLTMGLISPIRQGMTIVFDKLFMPNRFLRQYITLEKMIFVGVPEIINLLNNCIGEEHINITNAKWFFCSSSALNYKIGENFNKKTNIWLNQVYGMMEASTIAANLSPNKNNFISVGNVVSNVDLVIDKNIYIKSKAISNDYIVNGEEKEIQKNNYWFNTGDEGIIKNSDLYLFERK